MPLIAIIMLASVFATPLQTNPKNLEEFNQAFTSQFENPVIKYTYKVNN